jgi:AcrR family transcriptional regulator
MPKIVAQKKDWIKLGYKLFSEQGVSGIVIEKMSRKLKCNKSSFYWHFKTKKEFIDQMVEFWVNNETEQIIKLTENEKPTSNKIKTLIELVYKKMPNQDFVFYLKRYAQKDKKTLIVIENIDNTRVEYVKVLLQEIGYTSKDAKLKSSILYKHLIGYHEIMRYKEQDENFLKGVLNEINQFIKV